MRILLATLLALTLIPATAAAQDPAVTTGPATPVGANSATLTGSFTTAAPSATWYFQFGTATGYGSTTPQQVAAPGPVDATITGLSLATTYHFRLVVLPTGGAPVFGNDATFTTAATPVNPARPGVSKLAAVDKTPTSARLTALVDPNRAATTAYMEWGTTTRFGNRTPDQVLPAGDAGVPVSAAISSLPVHQRIYWRVVATNSAGVRRTGSTSFTTPREPTGITLGASPAVVPWGGTLSLAGHVAGAGVNGLTVALQQTPFPFSAGFTQVATARVTPSGDFRFASRPLPIATQFRAVTLTTLSVTSPTVGAQARAQVGIRRTGRTRRSLRLAGGVHPGLPDGVATLQRRTRRGGWAVVVRKPLKAIDATTSRYGFRVLRQQRTRWYRVKVTARDGGAHLGAASAARRVRGR
jgi:hypothetical protein